MKMLRLSKTRAIAINQIAEIELCYEHELEVYYIEFTLVNDKHMSYTVSEEDNATPQEIYNRFLEQIEEA